MRCLLNQNVFNRDALELGHPNDVFPSESQ